MRKTAGVLAVLLAGSIVQAAITRGPVLQPTTDMETSVGIMWRCDNSSSGTVNYGIASVSENTVSTPAGTKHEVTLTGLSAGTEYKYQVICDGTTTPVYTFRTSSASQERRVLVLSDVHAQQGSTWEPQQAYWLDDWLAYDPDLVVMTGDVVTTGNDMTCYDALFNNYQELFATAIVAPIPGNHEWASGDPDLSIYSDVWYLPQNCPGAQEKNYYFDYAGVRWVMIANSEFSGNESWAQSALGAGSGFFRVACTHYPIYLSCEYDDEMAGDITSDGWKVDLRSVLEATSADIHFAGHRHLYHRSRPLLSTVASPAVSPPIGSGWGGPTTSEATNYTDPDGVIYFELHSLWYQKTGAIYQRSPFFAAVGPEYGSGGDEWLGYVTVTVAGPVCTVDSYACSRDGTTTNAIDHFVINKGGGSSVSGTITDGTNPIAGVRVEIDASHSAYTNASGQYTIVGVSDGTYTVTPSKLGYTFTPASRSVTVSGSDVTGVDFTGEATGGTVVFQEGLSGYSGVDDVMIRASSPDTNYGDHDEIRAVMGASDVERMSLIRFDLSAIPAGATVTNAVLEIYLFNRAGDGNFHIGTMSVDWAEMEATWNERLNGTSWPGADARSSASEFATVPQGSSGNWISFPVTSQVQAWVNSTPNYGFLIWPDGTVDDRFWSSDYTADTSLRPKLTVTYAGPTPDTEPPAAQAAAFSLAGTVSDASGPPATVLLNGSTDVPVTGGQFTTPDVPLSSGDGSATIQAQDASSNTTTVTVTVNTQ